MSHGSGFANERPANPVACFCGGTMNNSPSPGLSRHSRQATAEGEGRGEVDPQKTLSYTPAARLFLFSFKTNPVQINAVVFFLNNNQIVDARGNTVQLRCDNLPFGTASNFNPRQQRAVHLVQADFHP